MTEQLTSRYLEHRDNGDTYWLGPLNEAKATVARDRHPTVQNGHLCVHVMLYEAADSENVAEWGIGPTEEAAWRFALGAYFGPLDEAYPGDEYVKALLDQTTEPEQDEDDDTEGRSHCEDCGHWLDSKEMCPSCLPNSQRNPDERVEE